MHFCLVYTCTLPFFIVFSLQPDEPTKLEANAESTLIDLKWKKPVFIQNQKLNYEVICDGVSLLFIFS
jgi:hypothetical protein